MPFGNEKGEEEKKAFSFSECQPSLAIITVFAMLKSLSTHTILTIHV